MGEVRQNFEFARRPSYTNEGQQFIPRSDVQNFQQAPQNYQPNVRPQQILQPNDSPPMQQHNVPKPQPQQHFYPQVQPSPPVTYRNNQNFTTNPNQQPYHDQQKLNYPQPVLKTNPQLIQQSGPRESFKNYDNEVVTGMIQNNNNQMKNMYPNPNNPSYGTSPDNQKHIPKPILTQHVLTRSDSQRSFTALNQSPEPIVTGRLASATTRDYDDRGRQYVQQPYERMTEKLPERSNLQQMNQPKQLVPNLVQQNFVPQQQSQMQSNIGPTNQQFSQRPSAPIGLNTLITAQREPRPQGQVAFQLPGEARNQDFYTGNRQQGGMNDNRGLSYVYPSDYDRRRPMSVDRMRKGDNDSGVDESTQEKGGQISPSKPISRTASTTPRNNRSRSTSKQRLSLKTPESPVEPLIKKVPMNKIQVGAAPSPNLKQVKSKIGSLDNASHRPGGGNVKIENRKIEIKAAPRIAAKNENYQPKAGEKKIISQKLQWNAQSKIGSLANANHKPGGGNKKIEEQKLDFKEKAKPKIGSLEHADYKPSGGDVKIVSQKIEIHAQSKIGSLDNIKHKPGGGDIKIFDDKEYLKNVEHPTPPSQSPLPSSLSTSITADENLNQQF